MSITLEWLGDKITVDHSHLSSENPRLESILGLAKLAYRPTGAAIEGYLEQELANFLVSTMGAKMISEKGGEGSGDWGHAGRPGKVGGSAASGGAHLGESYGVREHFGYGPISKRSKATAEAAFDLIDKVHGDGGLNRIIVKENSRKNAAQMMHRISDGLPFELDMSKVEHATPIDICHEIGHAIGSCMIEGRLGQDGSTEYAKMVTLIKFNPGTKRMANAIEQYKSEKVDYRAKSGQLLTKRVSVDHNYYQYLQRPQELFARAYAQYIATRSKDSSAMADIQKYNLDTIKTTVREKEHSVIFVTAYPHQWREDEFEPIAQAFDGLFERLGWK